MHCADTGSLLRRYLRWIIGLVDSDTLPLNVSREMLQMHSSLKTIKKKLVRKALDMIRKIADSQTEVPHRATHYHAPKFACHALGSVTCCLLLYQIWHGIACIVIPCAERLTVRTYMVKSLPSIMPCYQAEEEEESKEEAEKTDDEDPEAGATSVYLPPLVGVTACLIMPRVTVERGDVSLGDFDRGAMVSALTALLLARRQRTRPDVRLSRMSASSCAQSRRRPRRLRR